MVIDYLWGTPAARSVAAIVPARARDDQLLTWIQIGSVAGPEAGVPSAALRATCLQIVGSGQGSVATHHILAELPALAAEVDRGAFVTDTRTVPLTQVEEAWAEATTSNDRIVIGMEPAR